MLTASYPYETNSPLELKKQVTEGNIDYSKIKNPDAKELLQSMLVLDQDKRATLK